MRSKKWIIGCGAGILIMGIILAVIILTVMQVPEPADQLALKGNVAVYITLPLNESTLTLKQPVSIFSEAVASAPIQNLELWVDGVPIQTILSSSAPGKTMSTSWSWTPLEQGSHTLLARASAEDGQTGISGAVTVNVLPLDQIPTPTPLAQELPPQAVTLEAPILNPTDQAANGTPIDQLPYNDGENSPPPPPFPPNDPPPNSGEPPAAGLIPIKYDLWAQGLFSDLFPETKPAAPGLWGAVKNCDVTLTIQDNADNEAGFFLYRLNPGAANFIQVAKMDSRTGKGVFSYLDAALGFGKYQYTLSAVNSAGDTPGPIVSVSITNDACKAASPQVVGLKNAKLKASVPVDMLYCYRSVDNGPWERIPPGANQFIQPTNGEFDLGQYLDQLISPPPPGGVDFTLDCWGWNGGTLTYLGQAKQSIGTQPFIVKALGFELFSDGAQQQLMKDPPDSPKIAPPTDAGWITNPGYCEYFGRQELSNDQGYHQNLMNICDEALKNGSLVLGWQWNPFLASDKKSACSWNPNNPFPDPKCPDYNVTDISGFRVFFSVGHGSPPIMAPVSIYNMNHFAIVPALPVVGSFRPEFTVQAWKADGNLVSDISNAVKVSDPAQGIKLPMVSHREYLTIRWKSGNNTYSSGNQGYPGGCCQAGYSAQPGAFSIMPVAFIKDTAVRFDLSKNSHPVVKATLYWKWGANSAYGPGVEDMLYSCKNSLNDANGILYNYPLKMNGGYDVTPQVRAWAQQGKPYAEFFIKSGIRYPSETLSACDQTYDKFYLQVVYYHP